MSLRQAIYGQWLIHFNDTLNTKTDLPHTNEFHQKVGREPRSKHLRDDKHIGSKCRLEHDGHVGRVEEFYRVRATLPTETVALDRDLNAEALQVNNNGKDDSSGNQVHDVRETVPPESLAECASLVIPGEEEMEESNDCTFKLWTTTGVDSRWGECLPDDGFANIGGDEKRDAGTKTVTLLEELIKQNDDESCSDELDDEQQANTGTQILGLPIKTREHINSSLTERDDEGEH